MLTNEELNAINRNLESHLGLFSDAEMDRDQKTYCTFRPHELHSMKEAIDELLALRSLRDAGDDEVEELYSNAVRIALFSTNANDRKISVTNIAELRDIAIARGQTRTDAVNKAAEWANESERLQEQLREAREKCEHKSQQVDSQVSIVSEMQSQIDTLTEENKRLREVWINETTGQRKVRCVRWEQR